MTGVDVGFGGVWDAAWMRVVEAVVCEAMFFEKKLSTLDVFGNKRKCICLVADMTIKNW